MIFKDLNLAIGSSYKEIFKSNYLIITKTKNGTQTQRQYLKKGKKNVTCETKKKHNQNFKIYIKKIKKKKDIIKSLKFT